MNTALIPRYDLLGSPAPPWLAQALMALTLAFHWAFVAATVGGTVAVLIAALRGAKDLVRGLAPWLPFFLSAAMTLGIAPLLFVQVLYGQFFYTSNILLGYWWLGLLGLVIVAFYLFWWGWHRTRQGRLPSWLIPAVALVVLATAAAILSSNATLMQTPEAWAGLWARGMSHVYAGDPTFVPRVLFALSGFVGAGSLLVAVLSRAGLLYEGAAAARGRALGLRIAVPALAVQMILGAILLFALPAEQRSVVLTGGVESAFFYLAAAALLASVPLTWMARKAESLGRLICPAVIYFVGLLSLALVRDMVRRAALAPVYQLSSVPVHAEWGNFALFLVVFLAGLGVIAYLVKLAATRPAAQHKERPDDT